MDKGEPFVSENKQQHRQLNFFLVKFINVLEIIDLKEFPMKDRL